MSRLLSAVFLALGGSVVAGTGYFAYSRSKKTKESVDAAVRSGGIVKIHATGYWPFSARPDEQRMEGGVEGAAAWRGRRVVDPRTGKRVKLHTLEQYLANPTAHPEVSVSGDPEVWPFGQRIVLSPWPNAVFRVVDTGGHFTGAGKVFRVVGEEPLDICVDSSRTNVPKKNVTATIVAGDNWEGGQAVALSKLRDPRVVVGSASSYLLGTDVLGAAAASSVVEGVPIGRVFDDIPDPLDVIAQRWP